MMDEPMKHMQDKYTCPMHPEIVSDKPGKCPKCGMKLEKTGHTKTTVPEHHTTGTLYTCPMDPDIIRDEPGECPKCGMDLVPMVTEEAYGHDAHRGKGAEADFKRRFFTTLPFVLLIMALSPNIEKWLGFSLLFTGKDIVTLLIGAFIFFYGGWPFFKASKGELTHKNPAMMTLVAFAITAGFAFSVAATFLFPDESLYWEIATLISVFLLGHWLEMRAVRGATGALSELAKLIPPSAHLLKNGTTEDVETSRLVIGDRILVKPGEKIPIDGKVTDGVSSVSEAMLTGESRPIAKKTGDLVVGGALNQDGALTIEVTKTGADTAVAQIMKLVREAQGSKPNVQHLADRAATVLFYVAVAAGAVSFAYWFFISPQGAVFAATVAVSAIVIACPHALGLAIPTVTSIATTLGANNGILIKDMKGLEIARKLNYVVFDKTGTLTEGKFGVTDILLPQTRTVKTADELLKLAAAVETMSQHSIAQGIVNETKKRGLSISGVKDFKSFPGKGAVGTVNGKTVLVGNKALLKESNVSVNDSDFDTRLGTNTPVYVAVNRIFVGLILLSDIIRNESKKTIEALHDMGIKTAMLTGDTQDVADQVGRELGVDTVFAHVLPEAKVDKVKELQKKGNIVAMVGDGVNDAAALTQSHAGIAIGAGTDVAVASAEIVLMKSNPLDVAKAISLSRKTNSKMVQNLAWATGYNVFAIPIAAGILYPAFGLLLRPEWAALLMSASSVIVVFNALSLRRAKL